MKVVKYRHLPNFERVLGIIVGTWIVMYFIIMLDIGNIK